MANWGCSPRSSATLRVCKQWYRKAMAIFEKQGDEHGAAITYHQLGMDRHRSSATSRVRSSGTASRWRSLRSKGTSTVRRSPITTWGGSPRSSATSRVRSSGTARSAADQGEAGGRAQRGEHLSPPGDDRPGAARLRGCGSVVPQGAGDHEGEAGGQSTASQHGFYHHLGIIAQEHRDFASAEQWYRKVLAIFEKQGDEYRVRRSPITNWG